MYTSTNKIGKCIFNFYQKAFTVENFLVAFNLLITSAGGIRTGDLIYQIRKKSILPEGIIIRNKIFQKKAGLLGGYYVEGY